MKKCGILSLLLLMIMTTGCGQQITDSRKFVVACDTLDVSMRTINTLYDNNLMSRKDYVAASEVFFQAVEYILEWESCIDSGEDKPDIRYHVIRLSQRLATIALKEQEAHNE